MKKELIIFSLIFLFSMSFISAFSWSDLLPSGYAVSDSAVDSVDEDCVSKCLNNICSDFTSSLRKRLCLNSDVRKQQCESECIVGEETSSTSITGGEKEKTDSTSATDNNQIVKKPSAETSVNSNTASSSKTNPSVSANVSDDLTENIIPEVQANFTFPEEMQLWIEEQNKNYIKINGHVSGNPDYLEWDWGDSVVERSFFENEHWYNNLGDYEVKVTAYRNGNLIAKSNFIIIIEKLFTENVKDMSKYSDKEVFIISDKNWKEVLPLVPVTTWTGEENCNKGYGTPDNICVYPTLIYHEESRSFDADSIIYFMQQYNTQKATFIRFPKLELLRLMIAQPDFGVGLNSQQLKLIFPKDYFSYWGFYKDMVYVEDDYEKALLASSYASLINAPLIIKGTNLDKDAYFIADKNIICVGNVNRNCNEQYSLE